VLLNNSDRKIKREKMAPNCKTHNNIPFSMYLYLFPYKRNMFAQ
jgi:hypothetical protein